MEKKPKWRGLMFRKTWVLLAVAGACQAQVTNWVQPQKGGVGKGMWGIEGGLKFAIYPTGFERRGLGGPRGLIRIGAPVFPSGRYDLINFIAVEPVVGGHKGLSELEQSQLDKRQGKKFWTADPDESGKVTRQPDGSELLEVPILIEPFLNGASVRLTILQSSRLPDEIGITIHREEGSAPIEYCILTATMGNKVRARQLWLKDRTESSLDLYASYRGWDFTEHRTFRLDQLLQTPGGSVIAAITRDEPEGHTVRPWRAAPNWNYRGANVTQYWRKAPGTYAGDLHVAVNGRYSYWMSRTPIPGGVAFENFEMREKFKDGQQFFFGVTKKAPNELGWREKRQEGGGR